MTRSVLLASLLTIGFVVSAASAEELELSGPTPLRTRPSSDAPGLSRLASGQRVQALERQGSWIRVSAGGQTGWVAKSQVRAPSAKASAKKEREKEPKAPASTSRRASKAKPAAVAPPPAASDTVLTAELRDRVSWRRTPESASTPAAAPVAMARPVSVVADEERPPLGDQESPAVAKSFELQPSVGPRWSLAAGADLAFLAQHDTFASAGTGIRANYDVTRSAAALAAGLELRRTLSSRLVLGADVAYLHSMGANQIQIPATATDAAGAIQWSTQTLDGRLLLGMRLADDRVVVSAHAGVRWAQTEVDASDVAPLPSETVLGLVAGLAVDARLASRLGAVLSGDLLLAGGLSQATGMQDGERSSLGAYRVRLAATYRLAGGLEVHASYSLTLGTVDFAGASTREPTAVNGSRRDLDHVVALGLGYRL